MWQTGLRLFLRCVAIIACSFIAIVTAASAETDGLTVEELLKVEGFGEAQFDPSGRWLVYEQIRPYDTYPDYSFRTYAFRKSGHQLWQVDLKGDLTPRLIQGIDPAAHAYIERFSPSGNQLAVFLYEAGRLSLAACEMETGRCTRFGPVPATSWTGAYRPVWISEEDLVYAALPEGDESPEASLRAATGARRAAAWAAAWRGDKVTADEVRTQPPDLSSGTAAGRLVRVNVRTGEVCEIASGLFADLRLEPGGTRLAALSVSGQRPPEPGRPEDGDRRRHRLVLFDLADGTRREIAPELDVFPYTLQWAPEGGRLLAFGWPEEEGPANGRFHVIDAGSGFVLKFDHRGLDLASERERGFVQRPERAVFLGRDIAVYARPTPAERAGDALFTYRDIGQKDVGRADWYRLSKDGTHMRLTGDLDEVSAVPLGAGRACLIIQARQGIFCLEADGGRDRIASQSGGGLHYLPDGSFSTFAGLSRPDPGRGALVSQSSDRGGSAILLGPANRDLPQTLTLDLPQPGAVPVAGGLRAGAALFRSEDGPVSRLILVRDGAGSPGQAQRREIARINSHLEQVSFGAWQTVSYLLEDLEGISAPEQVESCLLLPPGGARRPLPLIVEVYPGSRPHCGAASPILSFPDPNSPYLWAGKGYAYARIALPREFIRTREGPIAGMDEAVEAALDALEKTGCIDPDQMVLSGFSQGAVSALYVAAHSDRFAAVIARNGWADLVSHYFGPPGIYSILDPDYFGSEFIRYEAKAGSDFGIGVTPFEDPEIYYRNSPVLMAPEIDAPVLLIHSDMDSFSMSQFDEMYSALYRAGKDTRYVRYWGEGHGPSSPANIADMWVRMDGFLDDHGIGPDRTP